VSFNCKLTYTLVNAPKNDKNVELAKFYFQFRMYRLSLSHFVFQMKHHSVCFHWKLRLSFLGRTETAKVFYWLYSGKWL